MIDNDILDSICPVPSEDEYMEDIKTELSDAGFLINNFNKGGIFYIIIRIFVKICIELKTMARQWINSLFIKHAEGDWLEIKAADFGKTRKAAVKTQGNITVIRSDYSRALQITKGHMFRTTADSNGIELKYYVLEDTVIQAGTASGKVLVEAEYSGPSYNVSADRITVSLIHLEGVDSVTNASDWITISGADAEDLEVFRQRVEESWSELAERTTEEKLKSVAKKVNGVLDVRIDAQHPRGQGTTDIIVTSITGIASAELLATVSAATAYLKGNYDDWSYKSSSIHMQDIDITIYLAKDASTDGVASTAKALIENLLNIASRTDLNNLYLDDIRYALKDGIKNYKTSQIHTPSADVVMGVDTVIMIGTVTIQVTNVT